MPSTKRSAAGVEPQAPGTTEAGEHGPCYVIVFETGTTRLVHLPNEGDTVVGTAETAGVRLRSESVLAHHATISTHGPEALLTAVEDGSQTRINDAVLVGTHVLTSGDVISVGDTTLGFHRNATRVAVRPAMDRGQFHRRLEEEIERALRYQNPLALLLVDPGSGPADLVTRTVEVVCRVVRRVDIVGQTGRSEIAVLFPETGQAAGIAARRVMDAVLAEAPLGRGGLAVCPGDGCEPDTLLTGARSAARAATPGNVGLVSSAASTFAVGDRDIVAADPVMKSLFALVRQLAASALPVLVHGETGAGKEIVAQALHDWSPRHSKRIVAINCAALPESLLESELFGHERGAFSGAIAAKPGLFERATGGTVFLDEVGECSPITQAKLLRVLETHRVSRVGGNEERPVEVRIVSATNRSLEDEIRNGRFRQDLYYRLNAAAILVPPLRDRPLDVPLLARRFLDEACDALGRPRMVIAGSAMQRLVMHAWPGNVRELKNVMDFVAASALGAELTGGELPEQIAATVAPWMLPRGPGRANSHAPTPRPPTGDQPRTPPEFRNIYQEIAELEKRRMREALEATGGVRARAAELIKMPLRTFVTKLKVHGLAVTASGGSDEPRPKT